jgi:hypothetical protein
MGSMQKPDGSLRREETSAGSLQKPHLKLRLIPMRIHKRSVLLSRSIVFIAGFSASTRGLSLCRGRRAGLLSRSVVFVVGFSAQEVCPFVAAGGQAFCRD